MFLFYPQFYPRLCQNHEIFLFFFCLVFTEGCSAGGDVGLSELLTNTKVIRLQDLPENFVLSDFAIGSEGEIFGIDKKRSRVICFSKEGQFVRQIGWRTKYVGELIFPNSIATDLEGNVYIGCRNEVVVFQPNGTRWKSFEIDFRAHSIAVDAKKNIYLMGVKDENSIHKYSLSGELIISFGEIFQHADRTIREKYSGGKITVVEDALFVNHRSIYNIVKYTLGGEKLSSFKRSDIDLSPKFQKIPKGYKYAGSSTGGEIHHWQDFILVNYHLTGRGIFMDIYDMHNQPVCLNISLSTPLIIDGQNFAYYMNGNAICRGNLLPIQDLCRFGMAPVELDGLEGN